MSTTTAPTSFSPISRGVTSLLEGVYGSRLKQIPTASYGSLFNDPEPHTIDARQYLDLQYDRHFGDDWGVMARVSYDHNPFDFAGGTTFRRSAFLRGR